MTMRKRTAITQTPLRASLTGGGSDLSAFYEQYGPGAVVSLAINQYLYVTVHQRQTEPGVRVVSSAMEEVESSSELHHELARETLGFLGFRHGVEVASVGTVPGHGTGLGSSSAYVVGLLHALHGLLRGQVSAATLAEQACEIELERCSNPVGKQDAYAAAYGGINYLVFHPTGTVSVQPITLSVDEWRLLETHLLLVAVGGPRSAGAMLRDQRQRLGEHHEQTVGATRQLVALAQQLRAQLARGFYELRWLGELLEEGWQRKQEASQVPIPPDVASVYATARRCGAWGGKLLGAGGGGFLLLVADPELHARIRLEVARPTLPVQIARGSRLLHLDGAPNV